MTSQPLVVCKERLIRRKRYGAFRVVRAVKSRASALCGQPHDAQNVHTLLTMRHVSRSQARVSQPGFLSQMNGVLSRFLLNEILLSIGHLHRPFP